MSEILLAPALAALIGAPHLLPLHRVAPVKASMVWLLALAVRALVSIGTVVFLVVYVPQTALFEGLLRSCWHAVMPLLRDLDLTGHPFADAALLVPGLALTASAIWVVFGIARGWLAVRSYVAERLVGEGPLGSSIVQDDEVVIATSRVGRARVMVSDVAFDVMDEDELVAGLSHELGHLRRRHRPVLVLASILAAVGRLVPGTVLAERALVLSLERDADDYAIRRTQNPLALASAICKAAAGTSSTAIALGGEGGVSLRLDQLLHGGVQRGGPWLERLTTGLALLMTCAVFLITFLLPSWAAAAPDARQSAPHSESACAQQPGPAVVSGSLAG